MLYHFGTSERHFFARFGFGAKQPSLKGMLSSCDLYYRKRGSASYIVREVREVGERDTERDGSGVTLVALKLAMSFALFFAKNFHLSIGGKFCTFLCQKFAPLFLPSWRALSSHFPLPKTLHSSKQFPFSVLLLSNGVTEDRSTKTNDQLSGLTVLLLIEKMNQIKSKIYWK